MSYRKFSEEDPAKEAYDSEVFTTAISVIEMRQSPYDEDIVFEVIQELNYPAVIKKYEVERGFIEDVLKEIEEIESDRNEVGGNNEEII